MAVTESKITSTYLGRYGLPVVLGGGASTVVHDAAVIVRADGSNLVRFVSTKVVAPTRCYVCPIDSHILVPVNNT